MRFLELAGKSENSTTCLNLSHCLTPVASKLNDCPNGGTEFIVLLFHPLNFTVRRDLCAVLTLLTGYK